MARFHCIREQQKYEKRKQTSADNTVNNLRHKSLKIVLKIRIPFSIKHFLIKIKSREVSC